MTAKTTKTTKTTGVPVPKGRPPVPNRQKPRYDDDLYRGKYTFWRRSSQNEAHLLAIADGDVESLCGAWVGRNEWVGPVETVRPTDIRQCQACLAHFDVRRKLEALQQVVKEAQRIGKFVLPNEQQLLLDRDLLPYPWPSIESDPARTVRRSP